MRFARLLAALVLCLGTAIGAAGLGASAVSSYTLIVEPEVVAAGGAVQAVGRGFDVPGEELHLRLDDPAGVRLADVTVSENGTLTTEVTIPENTEEGPHQIIVCRTSRVECLVIASDSIRVVAPEPPPPPPPPPPPTTPPPPPPPPPDDEAVVTPVPTPTVPGDIATTEEPDCCDPPAPIGPGHIQFPPQPTVPPLVNPGGGDPIPDELPDIYVRSIEVTQNIQDLDSSMPLVADRRTWIRVHPRLLPQHETLDAVTGAVLLLRASGEHVILYPHNLAVTVDQENIPRWQPDSALNFLVPEDWDDEGFLTVRALVWWNHPSRIADEPNGDNNLMTTSITFHEGSQPNIYVMPLDDGGGPGPDPDIGLALAGAIAIYEGILTYHPVADVPITLVPQPVGPGVEASEIGLWDLTTSAGRTEPLQRLFGVHWGMGLDEDARIFGIFDDSIPSGGFSGWAKSVYRSTWIQPVLETAAHEGGHLTSLGHVDCIGTEEDGGALDEAHPNAAPDCSLAPVDPNGHYGFTVMSDEPIVYSNDPTDPVTAFPLMSYADDTWSDAYHYCKMLNFYDVPCSASGIGVPGIPTPTPHGHVDCTPEQSDGIGLELCLNDPNAPDYDNISDLDPSDISILVPDEPTAWALVSGYLDFDTQRVVIDRYEIADELSGALLASYQDVLTAVREGEVSGGVNQISVDDKAGSQEYVVPLVTDLHAGHGPDGAGGDEPIVPFAQVVPIPDDAATINFRIDGWEDATTLTLADEAPDAPDVDLGSWSTAQGLSVNWEVPSSGEPLATSVYWRSGSAAAGVDWYPVVIGSLQNSVDVPPDAGFPGGEVLIKVVVNDGGRTAEWISELIPVPDQPPIPLISSILDGDTVNAHDVIELRSLSYDPEDGALENGIWTSSVDGELGSGRRVTVEGLTVGEHELTLTVTDSAGSTASATVHMTVEDDGSPAPLTEGAVPEAELILVAGSVPSSGDSGGAGLWLISGSAVVLAAGVASTLYLRRRKGTPA